MIGQDDFSFSKKIHFGLSDLNINLLDISPLNITQGYEVYTGNVPANQTFFIYNYLCKNTEKKNMLRYRLHSQILGP